MKTLKIFIVAAFILTSGTTVMAQEKLAYLNTNEILMAMPEMDSARVKLEAFEKELQETLEAMQVEYNNKANELQKNTATWTQTMLTQKTKELNGIRENIQAFNETAPQDYQKKQGELMEPIYNKLRDAIKAVGKENNYAYVLDASSLLYFDEVKAINAAQAVKNKLGIKK